MNNKRILRAMIVLCMAIASCNAQAAAIAAMPDDVKASRAPVTIARPWSLMHTLKTAAVSVLSLGGVVGDAAAPSPRFNVLAQQIYDEGYYGPGYPVSHRLLSADAYRADPVYAGQTQYGLSYSGHAEFTDGFVEDALEYGAHALELAPGLGHNVRAILTRGEGYGSNLTLVELSQSNVATLKGIIAKHGRPEDDVSIYQGDARAFLSETAEVRPWVYDTIGAFHVMHFWSPTEILKALQDMHRVLKTQGTVTVTFSANVDSTNYKYAEQSKVNPWAGSVFCDKISAESYKASRKSGQIVTTLPAQAWAELFRAYGFDVRQASSYADFYPQNIGTPAIEYSVYEGIRAEKKHLPDEAALLRWREGAKRCDAINAEDHRAILTYPSTAQHVKQDRAIKKQMELQDEIRRHKLYMLMEIPATAKIALKRNMRKLEQQLRALSPKKATTIALDAYGEPVS